MKNALISPNEPRETGYRVAQISDVTFEVAPPLFWVECSDDIVTDQFWYNPANQSFEVMPEPIPVIPVVIPGLDQPETQGAQTL